VFKQSRLRGASSSYLASIVAADGKIVIASQSGIVVVLKPGGEQELLSANNLDEDIFATPAIDRNRIFIRTVGALYCFGVLDDKRVTAQQERVVGGRCQSIESEGARIRLGGFEVSWMCARRRGANERAST